MFVYIYIYKINTNCGLQGRQYIYNVPFRPVNTSIVAEECTKHYIFCVFVCSLSYPACNAHAPYCHL